LITVSNVAQSDEIRKSLLQEELIYLICHNIFGRWKKGKGRKDNTTRQGKLYKDAHSPTDNTDS